MRASRSDQGDTQSPAAAAIAAPNSYPLTPLQQGMLFDSLHSPYSGVDIGQLVCTLDSPPCQIKLARSAADATQRHDVLRTGFTWAQGQGGRQFVAASTVIPIATYDWRHATEAAFRANVDDFFKADRARGFDLACPPLLRIAILSGPKVWHVVVTHHHIILDGRCAPQLLHELLGTCQDENEPTPLPAFASYRTYVDWVLSYATDLADEFWQNELHGLESSGLLIRALRSGTQAINGGPATSSIVEFVDPITTRALVQLSNANGFSVVHLVNAAWAILLSRYTDRSDVIFGVTRALPHPELTGILGLMINTLPLRASVAETMTVGALVEAIRDRWRKSRAHLRGSLANVLRIASSLGLADLFDTVVLYDPLSLDEALRHDHGLQHCSAALARSGPKYPLVVRVQGGPRLRVELLYDPIRVGTSLAQQLLSHFRNIFTALAGGLDQPIRAIQMLTKEEEHRILHNWNDTQLPFDADICLHQLFEAQARRRPESLALVGRRVRMTYRELDAAAETVRDRLLSAGAGRGDAVAVCFPRCPEMVAAVLGILKAGAAYVPLQIDWPPERVKSVLQASHARLLLVQTRHQPNGFLEPMLGAAADVGANVIALDEPESNKAGAVPTVSSAKATDVAYIIFTSGSTGVPKGVVVTHCPVVNVIEWVNRQFAVGPGDVLLFVTSLSFDLSVYDIFGTLAAGATIRLADDEERQDPTQLLRIIQTERITFWDSAPASLQQLVPLFSGKPLGLSDHLRLVFLSGDWIPLSLAPLLRTRFPNADVIALGGATEAVIWSNWFRVGEIDPNWLSVPYGRPIQNARYYILNRALMPCPIGVEGDLYIGGICVAEGYANDPSLTHERFLPDAFSPDGGRMYKTGDRARFMADGNIEFLGRNDGQVKIRGYRVELGEIETHLRTHPGVRDAVASVHQAGGAKQLVAHIVPALPACDTQAIRAHLQSRVPDYMVPTEILVIAHIPLTANGKLDRSRLPLPSRGTVAGDLPRTDVERTLAEIWKRILGVELLNRDDDFFRLGGDSLNSVDLVASASAKGIEFGVRDVFEQRTLSRLASVAVAPKDPAYRPTPVGSGTTVPLTPTQLWLFSRQLADPHHYNTVFWFDLPATLNPERFSEAVESVALRHDAFALRFERRTSGWSQHLRQPACPIEQVNLAGASPEDRNRLAQSAVYERRANMDLARGPLATMLLFNLGHGWRCALVVHHLIFDGYSLRLFADQIRRAYCGSPPTTAESRTSSFAAWAEALHVYACSMRSREFISEWLSLPWSDVTQVPTDFDHGANTYGSMRIAVETISLTATRSLQSGNRPLAELLAQGFAEAWLCQTKGPALVDVTGHGRVGLLGVDLSQTIGYITCNSPAILMEGEPQSLRRPPEVSWGVLRYLCPPAHGLGRLRALPEPETKFNYQGDLDTAPLADDGASLLLRPIGVVSPGALNTGSQRHYLLNIETYIRGGRLHLECRYSSNRHQCATIADLLRAYHERILCLATEGTTDFGHGEK